MSDFLSDDKFDEWLAEQAQMLQNGYSHDEIDKMHKMQRLLLNDYLCNNDLQLLSIPGDGNCFYNAVSCLINKVSIPIRSRIANALGNPVTWNQVKDYFPDTTQVDLIEEVITNGKWVPDALVQLVPSVIKYNIKLHYFDFRKGEWGFMLLRCSNIIPVSASPCINLVWFQTMYGGVANGSHYDAAVSKSTLSGERLLKALNLGSEAKPSKMDPVSARSEGVCEANPSERLVRSTKEKIENDVARVVTTTAANNMSNPTTPSTDRWPSTSAPYVPPTVPTPQQSQSPDDLFSTARSKTPEKPDEKAELMGFMVEALQKGNANILTTLQQQMKADRDANAAALQRQQQQFERQQNALQQQMTKQQEENRLFQLRLSREQGDLITSALDKQREQFVNDLNTPFLAIADALARIAPQQPAIDSAPARPALPAPQQKQQPKKQAKKQAEDDSDEEDSDDGGSIFDPIPTRRGKKEGGIASDIAFTAVSIAGPLLREIAGAFASEARDSISAKFGNRERNDDRDDYFVRERGFQSLPKTEIRKEDREYWKTGKKLDDREYADLMTNARSLPLYQAMEIKTLADQGNVKGAWKKLRDAKYGN